MQYRNTFNKMTNVKFYKFKTYFLIVFDVVVWVIENFIEFVHKIIIIIVLVCTMILYYKTWLCYLLSILNERWRVNIFITRIVGNLVNGFQKDVEDVFGSEGGEIGKVGLRADVTALPEMYPPPTATRRVPIRIDFFNNSKNVNVGHFNNISMPSHDGYGIPLLERYLKNRTTTHGKSNMAMTSSKMMITTFDSNEVLTYCTFRILYWNRVRL